MRILLVTLFYLPLNNIAVTRMLAFKKNLEELGHEVDVLTRHYNESDVNTSNLCKGMNSGDDFEGDFYLKNDVIYTKFSNSNSKLIKSEKLPKGIRGIYNLNQLDIYHYSFFTNAISAYAEVFKTGKHDIVIASTPVPACLQVGKRLCELYGMKWIADFRDSYVSGNENLITSYLKKRALNSVLSNCSGILFVSEGMKQQNEKVLNKANNKIPTELVYNGFSDNKTNINTGIIEEVKKIKKDFSKVLVYTGTIYKSRNLNFFLKATELIKDLNIAIIVVGIQSSYKEEIIKKYPHLNLFFFDKVSYSTSIKIQELADYLLLTIWKGFYTGFSGKVFEYLHSGVPIILDYEPPLDLKEYLNNYNNIHYCNESYSEFENILKENKVIIPLSKEQKTKLSRKYQVNKLNDFILKIISDND
jgi:glycosyltransferase involved in cell wall biosynthesis